MSPQSRAISWRDLTNASLGPLQRRRAQVHRLVLRVTRVCLETRLPTELALAILVVVRGARVLVSSALMALGACLSVVATQMQLTFESVARVYHAAMERIELGGEREIRCKRP